MARKKKHFLLALGIFFITILGLALYLLTPEVSALKGTSITYQAYDFTQTERIERVAGPSTGNWVASKDIPRFCKDALIAAEDLYFYRHYGVSLNSIFQAIKLNLKKGELVWGGSSLSQQLIKNVFLSREKTWTRKTREVLGAIALDRILSKDEQLAWYFNVVEYGPEIYGIKDAAQLYFSKEVSRLDQLECLLLANIMTRPLDYYEMLLRRRYTRDFIKRMANTLLVLLVQEKIDHDAHEELLITLVARKTS